MSIRTADRSVGARAAAELAGISYRQLDYWVRSGFVSCGDSGRGSGTRRRFSYSQVVRLAELAAVKAALGPSADIGVVIALVDGDPLDRPVIAGHTVPMSITVDLDAVRAAVAAAWPYDERH